MDLLQFRKSLYLGEGERKIKRNKIIFIKGNNKKANIIGMKQQSMTSQGPYRS